MFSRLLLMSCGIAVCGLRAATAPAPPVEVFAGYSLGKTQSESDSNRGTVNGWNTSITGYPWKRLGFTAEAAGFDGTSQPTGASSSDGAALSPVSVRQYSIMAGPQFRLIRKERFQTSIRALVGGAYGRLPTTTYSTLEEGTLAALFGSNFDVNVSTRVGIRFSPGMYLTQFGGQTQRTFRFSIGPVFRFGGE